MEEIQYADPGADSEHQVIPRHVAIIMDGNGRWAQQRGLPRLAGHRQGASVVRKNHDRGMSAWD